jgi:hypothetical protein
VGLSIAEGLCFRGYMSSCSCDCGHVVPDPLHIYYKQRVEVPLHGTDSGPRFVVDMYIDLWKNILFSSLSSDPDLQLRALAAQNCTVANLYPCLPRY